MDDSWKDRAVDGMAPDALMEARTAAQLHGHATLDAGANDRLAELVPRAKRERRLIWIASATEIEALRAAGELHADDYWPKANAYLVPTQPVPVDLAEDIAADYWAAVRGHVRFGPHCGASTTVGTTCGTCEAKRLAAELESVTGHVAAGPLKSLSQLRGEAAAPPPARRKKGQPEGRRRVKARANRKRAKAARRRNRT